MRGAPRLREHGVILIRPLTLQSGNVTADLDYEVATLTTLTFRFAAASAACGVRQSDWLFAIWRTQMPHQLNTGMISIAGLGDACGWEI